MMLDSVLVSTYSCPVFPVTLFVENIFFCCIFLPPLSKIMGTWIYLWTLYFVPLVYISMFVQVSYSFLISLWCSLKSESLTLLVPFFFFKIALAIQGLMCFHANRKIICSSFKKNIVGSLRGIALTLLIVLGGIFILTISCHPIQEHDMFLHLYVFCFLSSVLIFCLSGKVKVAQSCLTLCIPMD